MHCWGSSSNNQLSSPLGNYVQVDGGNYHYCALTIAGDVKCWGRSNEGQTAKASRMSGDSGTL